MFKFNQNNLLGNTTLMNQARLVGSVQGGSMGSSPSIGGGGSGGNWNVGSSFLGLDLSFHILQDIVNYQDQVILDKIFREIYSMCPTSGSCIDLLSRLPWSDYTLVGVQDTKILDMYKQSCEELSLPKLMRNFQTNKLTLGRAIGTLVFDSSRGIFTDCIIHNVTNCILTQIPLLGYDPKIDIKLDKDFGKFLKSNDPRDIEARREISPEMLAVLISAGKIELEPLKTIFISRNELVGCENMSILMRILPIWLLEKALLRGTVLGATRRQKPIMHITMGGGEDWDPDESQFASISQLFANADRDPLGAIVATRQDVSVNEVRNGSDFWRVSDEHDMFTQIKLRAFGLSESLLAGDATIGNADASITMLMEQLRTEREDMTNAICRDKIFLNLAKYHSFRKRTTAELNHNVRYSEGSNKAKRNEVMYKKAILTGSRNLAEVSKYEIPEVRWTRELQPKGDTSSIEVLRGLKEDGIPIPVAMLATAAGYSITTIVDSYKEDIDNRLKIKEYMDLLDKSVGGSKEEEENTDEGNEEEYGQEELGVESEEPSEEKEEASEESEEESGEEKQTEELGASVFREPIQLVSSINKVKDKKTLIAYLNRSLPEINLNKKQIKNLATYVKKLYK